MAGRHNVDQEVAVSGKLEHSINRGIRAAVGRGLYRPRLLVLCYRADSRQQRSGRRGRKAGEPVRDQPFPVGTGQEEAGGPGQYPLRAPRAFLRPPRHPRKARVLYIRSIPRCARETHPLWWLQHRLRAGR